jgi:DNA-binding beta-propeller fold protein YncE
VIDERSFRVVSRIPGGGYPDGIAYDPDTHTIFVSDEMGRTDTVIDTRTNRRVATIPLGGEAGNTQYDRHSRRILVDVQTRNQLATIDPRRNRVVVRAPLPGCQHDHGLLIDSTARLAFVACDENARLLTVDLRTMTVIENQSVGSDPDVLAFDQRQRRLFVAAESGILAVFEERCRRLHKVGQGFVAPEAHAVAVDSRTHRLYLPLENVNGRPVLRVATLLGER